jgi:hypothetical protein
MEALNVRLAEVLSDDVEFGDHFQAGVAFAAARLWDELDARAEAIELLGKLAPQCGERVAKAFGTVFWATEDFLDDSDTENLLNIIVKHPCVLSPHFVSDLVEHLAELCRFQTRLVSKLTRVIVEKFGGEVGDLRTSLYSAGPHLVNIAMTLQRFNDTRTEGLNILEDLMRLGVDEAFRILDDIDIRPSTRTAQILRTRRRRRKN